MKKLTIVRWLGFLAVLLFVGSAFAAQPNITKAKSLIQAGKATLVFERVLAPSVITPIAVAPIAPISVASITTLAPTTPTSTPAGELFQPALAVKQQERQYHRQPH